jgi:hypothetical protein
MFDERDPRTLALAEHVAEILNIALAGSGRMFFIWDGNTIPPPAVQPLSSSVH